MMKAKRRGEQKGKRIFGALILLVTAVLAMGTVTLAAGEEEWENSGSYSFAIEKKFDEKMPPEVLAAAKEKTYTFRIVGSRKTDSGEEIAVNTTITLPRMDENGQPVWTSERLCSGGPFNVTVTETTDSFAVADSKGVFYNVSGFSTNAAIQASGEKQALALRNDFTLTINRPSDDNGPRLYWYRVTSRQSISHKGDFVPLDMVFALEKGGAVTIEEMPTGAKLLAGTYTVERTSAPSAYQTQTGTRRSTVAAGEAGRFYITKASGTLTLTAGGTQGDGVIHCYTLKRTETLGDASDFVTQTIQIASGERYVLRGLPKGGYTVTEYGVKRDISTAFFVTMPYTAEITKNELSSAPRYSGIFRSFSLSSGTTYIRMNSFGPLYDADKQIITDPSVTYEFTYGWGDVDGTITYSSLDRTFNAAGTYSVYNSRMRFSQTPKIAFRVRSLTSNTAKYIGVSWTECTELEVTETFGGAGVQYTTGVAVDSRGWMTITAPASAGSETDQLVYYYTIRNSRNVLVTEKGGTTDDPDTTVMLKAGQSVTLTGLAAGSYKITETVKWAHAGFAMEVS